MYRRFVTALSAVICIGLAVPAAADDSESSTERPVPDAESGEQTTKKERLIRELLRTTGTPELGVEMAERILAKVKRTHPDVPEKFWEQFERETTREAFIDRLMPVYAEHFSREEIRKLLEFYRTDVGQKYVDKMPELTRRAMEAGRRWGQKIGQRVVDRLREEGYE